MIFDKKRGEQRSLHAVNKRRREIKLSSKDKLEKQKLAETICKKHSATLVNQIEHVIVIYKKTRASDQLFRTCSLGPSHKQPMQLASRYDGHL